MKKIVKSSLNKIPYALNAVRYLSCKIEYFKLKRMSPKDVFRHIYVNNTWGDSDSASGAGSNLEETKTLVEIFPVLLSKYCISSVLDIPCGDFHWMKTLNLERIEYIGADIVTDIIEQNRRFEKNNVRFEELDLIKDKLPNADLIFVRDCLVHLSYDDIFKALDNICKTEFKYLLTTTFTERTMNTDIATGQWRTLNIQIPPFNFPEPQLIINEGHPKKEWKDKSMGLWKVADIKNSLALMRRPPAKDK